MQLGSAPVGISFRQFLHCLFRLADVKTCEAQQVPLQECFDFLFRLKTQHSVFTLVNIKNLIPGRIKPEAIPVTLQTIP